MTTQALREKLDAIALPRTNRTFAQLLEDGFKFSEFDGSTPPEVPLDALVVNYDDQGYMYTLRLPDGNYWSIDTDGNFYPIDDSEGAVFSRYDDAGAEIECTLEEFALLDLLDTIEQEKNAGLAEANWQEYLANRKPLKLERRVNFPVEFMQLTSQNMDEFAKTFGGAVGPHSYISNLIVVRIDGRVLEPGDWAGYLVGPDGHRIGSVAMIFQGQAARDLAAGKLDDDEALCEGCGGEGVLLSMDPLNPPRCPACT